MIASVLKERRGAERHRAEVGRDRILLVSSVLLHALVILLLPGLSVPIAQPTELLIELVEPAALSEPEVVPITPKDDAAIEIPAGSPSPEPESSRPEAQSEPARKAAKPTPKPPQPSQPAPAEQTAPAPAKQEAASNSANEATPVVMPDPLAVQSLEPETPKAPAQSAPVEAGPVTSDLEQTAPGDEAEQPGTAEPQDQDEAQEPSEIQEPAGASITVAGEEALDEPVLPAGPSGHELSLLGDYGDGARRKILRLARNPEISREQGHAGTVKFAFEIAASGELKHAWIVEGSVYKELDNECLEATRVASLFGRFPRDVNVSSWTFEMTLKFPLY